MRLSPTSCVLGAVAAIGLVGGGAAVASGQASARASATLSACHPDPTQTARYATFAAQMTKVRGTKKMAMLFQLEERSPTEPFFHAVSAPGLGVWQTSAPGIGLFRLSQEVTNLPAPAAFRVIVRYRWQNARHHVIRRERLHTPLCQIPDERPNLVPGDVIRQPSGQKGQVLYDVVVRNDGLGPADPFAVSLSVNGTALADQTIPGLSPSSRADAIFTGPRCLPGQTLAVAVDSAGQINESSKADNTETIVCT